MKQITLCFFIASLVLAGCSASTGLLKGRDRGSQPKPDTFCEQSFIKPTIYQTKVEKQRIKEPTFDFNGTLLSPAAYQTVAVDQITEKKQTVSFRAICESDLTAEFILGLQQGLSARGFFDDRLTGSMDIETRRAIKVFQLEQGILSDWPSWETARMLGLEPL